MDLDEFIASLGPVQAFGTWDAPMTDDAVWIEVPTHLACMNCREHFEPGDNGAIMPNGFAQHRECGYRTVMGGIGHHVDHERYCRGELGPDAGLPLKVSARLVWAREIEGEYVGEETLRLLRFVLGVSE